MSTGLLAAIAIAVVNAGGAGAPPPRASADLPVDTTPGYPLEAPGARWSHRFAPIAGGGLRRPANGMVAGDADFGPISSAARAGDGRLVIAARAGLWAIGTNGRLSRVTGVPTRRDTRLALLALPNARVEIAANDSPDVRTLAPGSLVARPDGVADASRPFGIGASGGPRPVVVGGGRLLARRGRVLRRVGPKLWDDDGLTEMRGSVPTEGGLLVARVLTDNDPEDDPEQDASSLLLVGRGHVRPVWETQAHQTLRTIAPVGGGRAILATNASTVGELDGRPLDLAAGPTLDDQRFASGLGEEYFGWIARRRVLVRAADGLIERTRWAGPPADAVAPDGDRGDVLAVSGGRVWTSRPALGAPDVRGLWHGRVAVDVDTHAKLTVTIADPKGALLATRQQTVPRAGRATVALGGLPRRGLVRVTVTATTPALTRTTAVWAFAGPGALSLGTGRHVLESIARRLNVGFEFEAAHGVDRCRRAGATVVACRWLTGGSEAPHTARPVTVRLTPAGYVVASGRPRPAHVGFSRLLGAPFDASG